MKFENINTDPNSKEEILKRRGIERDQQGKLILYHDTTIRNFAKIIRSQNIVPPSKTNERTWRLPDEMSTEKLGKTYLASKDTARNIAVMMGEERGGTIMILEVHVNEDGLSSDEDSGADTWLDSIDRLGTCATASELADFGILERTSLKLSRHSPLALKLGSASDGELESIIAEIEAERHIY